MAEQIYCFLVCTLAGVAGGFLYDLCSAVRFFVRKKWVRIVSDVLFCALFAAAYLGFSVWLGLPALRFYMFAACLCGFFLYRKSFHKTVAILAQKMYNDYKRIRKGKRVCRKGLRCPKKKQRESS